MIVLRLPFKILKNTTKLLVNSLYLDSNPQPQTIKVLRVSNARIKQMANNLIHSCQGQTKEEEMLSTKTHKQGVRITYTFT